jgi:hypothetical protein
MSDGSNPFDFDAAFEPERAAPVVPASLEAGTPMKSDHRVILRKADRPSSDRPVQQRQLLPRVTLAVAVLAALGAGIGMYQALAGIHISTDPLGDFSDWMTLVAVSLCVAIAALPTGIVATVRSRPRTMGGLAIAASVVLPAIALILGIKFGMDVLAGNLHQEAAGMSTTGAQALRETLNDHHVQPNTFVDLVLRLLEQP